MGQSMNLPPGNRHPHTSSIIQLISKSSPGTLITDQDICRACDATRARWQPLMPTVIRALLKEHQIAISRERNISYRHLTDNEIPALAGKSIKHIRRVAKKTAMALTHGTKDYGAMSPTAQVEHNTQLAMIGTLYHLSTRQTEREIRSVVEVHNSKLDIGSTLKLLSNK